MELNSDTFKQLNFLYKGLDPELYIMMDPQIQKQANLILFKQLQIFAESGHPRGSAKVIKLITAAKRELSKSKLLELEALVTFGISFSKLTLKQKELVVNFEISDEFNHFSRIMGLDNFLNNKTSFPLGDPDAKIACKEFARFLILVFERRNQEGFFHSHQLLTQPESNYEISGKYGFLRKNKQDNLIAGVGSESKFNVKNLLIHFEHFLSKYPLRLGFFLFEFFLFITNRTFINSIFAIQEQKDSNQNYLTGLITQNLKLILLEGRLTNFLEKNISFSSHNPILKEETDVFIPTRTINIISPNRGAKVIIFQPKTSNLMSKKSKKYLENILNTQTDKKKIYLTDNIKLFQKNHKIFESFYQLTTGNPNLSPIDKKNTYHIPDDLITTPDLIKFLISKNEIVFENAHLHADRSPSETQFELVVIEDSFRNYLVEKGYRGNFTDTLMIDDYHVVNRLNYKQYLEDLKKYNFRPKELILESSPLLRNLSVDILKKLITVENTKIKSDLVLVTEGNNFYLKNLANGIVIELIQGLDNLNIIGCVLFDTAFTIYKANMKLCQKIYLETNKLGIKDNIHNKILDFFIKENDPVKRKDFTKSFYEDLPKLAELKENLNKIPFRQVLEPNKLTQVVNIHEIFYRPQQRKVNYLLKVLGLDCIINIFTDELNGKLLLEVVK